MARILLLTLALFLTSNTWSKAADDVDLSTGWSGSWSSNTTGHKGPLKARLTRQDETTVQARFRGRFFVVIPFRYSVKLQVVEDAPDHLTLSGSSRLPLFGAFHYSGIVTDQGFTLDYQSRNDAGQFQLQPRR